MNPVTTCPCLCKKLGNFLLLFHWIGFSMSLVCCYSVSVLNMCVFGLLTVFQRSCAFCSFFLQQMWPHICCVISLCFCYESECPEAGFQPSPHSHAYLGPLGWLGALMSPILVWSIHQGSSGAGIKWDFSELGWECSSVVQSTPNLLKAKGLILSTTRKQIKTTPQTGLKK